MTRHATRAKGPATKHKASMTCPLAIVREAVREAAVVGVPDAYRGETVKAFVSLRPGRTVGEDDLIAFCKERMAAYKYPRWIEFLDEIPKTVTGKLLRRELRTRTPS